MRVRKLEERDLDAAVELFIRDAEEAKHYPDPYHDPDRVLDHDMLRERFRGEFTKYLADPTALVCVALEDDVVAGFGIGVVDTCPRPGFFRSVEQVGGIEEVYVSPEYRLRGAARLMEAFLVDEFRRRGLKYVGLSFFTANEMAMQTWAALGYEPEMIRARKRI